MAEKNRYQGVNPHLMSYFQSQENFRPFHLPFIVNLAVQINKIRAQGIRACVADIIVENGRLYTTDEDTHNPTSVIIYKDKMPFAVIEFIYPDNKMDSQKYEEYRLKRRLIMQSSLVLVELDLLHETPPITKHMTSYPHGENSTPYYISIADLKTQTGMIYHFGINEPIPTLNIPLLEDDVIACDFDKVYQQTFEDGLFNDDVDYGVEPTRFSSYSLPDQQKIHDVMAKT